MITSTTTLYISVNTDIINIIYVCNNICFYRTNNHISELCVMKKLNLPVIVEIVLFLLLSLYNNGVIYYYHWVDTSAGELYFS